MREIHVRYRKLIGHVNAKFARSRRGSVLIMVVTLLVLMALMGTAYLLTSRNDRVAARLFQRNVQIGLLLNGAEAVAKNAIMDFSYQQAPTSGMPYQRYDDFFTTNTTSGLTDKSWVAARYPTSPSECRGGLPATGVPAYPVPLGAVVTPDAVNYYLCTKDQNTTAVNANGSGWVSWPPLPWPAVGGVPSVTGASAFWPAVSTVPIPGAVPEDPSIGALGGAPWWVVSSKAPRPEGVRTVVAPTSIFMSTQGINLPALKYYSPINNQIEACIAASACGNGIADSFLYRLPVSSIDGVTYYVAMHIIDNNSAIDLNTANSSSSDFSIATGAQLATAIDLPGMLPSAIGLTELTYQYGGATMTTYGMATDTSATSTESAVNNQYRFANAAGPRPAAATPFDDTVAGTGTLRSDYVYRSSGDALWQGLGRRSFNPGWVSGSAQFQGYSWSDAAALAFHFDLCNASAPQSQAEINFAKSTYNVGATPGTPYTAGPSYQSVPWDPSLVTTWFNAYYNEQNTASAPYSNVNCRRGYFTVHNLNNNMLPAHNLSNGTGFDLPSATATANLYAMTGSSAGFSPGYYNSKTIPRISLNTAPALMPNGYAPTGGGTIYLSPSGLTAPFVSNPKSPPLWLGFYNAMMDAPGLTAGAPVFLNGQSQMFRSPIRDVAGVITTSAVTGASYLTGPQALLLRSLLASLNCQALRNSVEIPPAAIVPFAATVGGTGAQTPVTVKAYGYERQPFITEVYASNDVQVQPAGSPAGLLGKQNTTGYVAVGIYNPYDIPLNVGGYQIATMKRAAGFFTPPTTIYTIPANTVIAPRNYLVLENIVAAATTPFAPTGSAFRPFEFYAKNLGSKISTITAPTVLISGVPLTGAAGVFGKEMVLLRPAPTTILQAGYIANAPINMIPVDSFDFADITAPPVVPPNPPAGTICTAIHYSRQSPENNTNPALATTWRFVYPGRYTATASIATTTVPRQEGLAYVNFTTPALDPWYVGTAGTHGNPIPNGTLLNAQINFGTPLAWVAATAYVVGNQVSYLGNNYSCLVANTNVAPGGVGVSLTDWGTPFSTQSTYINKFPAIQLDNIDFGGPAKLYTNTANPVAGTTTKFPFGAFARLGDILQVPFIGSYVITNPANSLILEMNPITMDCAMADDYDTAPWNTTVAYPVGSTVSTTSALGVQSNFIALATSTAGVAPVVGATWAAYTVNDTIEQVGRFCPLQAAKQSTETAILANATVDKYDWASHIFDCFTVLQNPHDDYMPNVDPNNYQFWDTNNLIASTKLTNTTVQNLQKSPSPNAGWEDVAPTEGLINVNTASWRVLAAVPFIQTDNAADNTANTTIAKAIVNYRNTYGPFKTLFELNRVQGLQNLYGTCSTADFQSTVGDVSPGLPTYTGITVGAINASQLTTDNVTNDFETRFATITRVSNLLTTRSDTFTVYILVQGWTGVGTNTPQVVVQRRIAFIADRSALTPTNTALNIIPIQSSY